MGTSSLLVEQGVRPGGLFAPGDRFIPFRPEETQFQGVQKFFHEENLLLSRQAKKYQRRNRRNTSVSDDDDSTNSRSRDSSRNSDNSNSNTSDNAEGGNGSSSTHASRQQRQNYNSLLQETCFGEDDTTETQVENLSHFDARMSGGSTSAAMST